MACYHPIPAYQAAKGEPVKLWPPVGTATVNLPCGTCLGCRVDRALDWARRAEHEAKFHQHNSFLTLTYDDKHLPQNGHLQPQHLTKFLKRLRKRAVDQLHKQGQTPTIDSLHARIRYLAAGEYGEKNGRPHYHLILFNCHFNDGKAVGKQLEESPTVTALWPYGKHKLGTVTGASANYVAQYSLKKIGYTPIEIDDDGVIKPAPFIRVSLKPPLGTKWIEKNKTDLQHGYLVTQDGRKGRIPRSYKQQLAKLDPRLAEQADYNASTHTRTKHDLRAAEAIHQRRTELNQQRPL